MIWNHQESLDPTEEKNENISLKNIDEIFDVVTWRVQEKAMPFVHQEADSSSDILLTYTVYMIWKPEASVIL